MRDPLAAVAIAHGGTSGFVQGHGDAVLENCRIADRANACTANSVHVAWQGVVRFGLHLGLWSSRVCEEIGCMLACLILLAPSVRL